MGPTLITVEQLIVTLQTMPPNASVSVIYEYDGRDVEEHLTVGNTRTSSFSRTDTTITHDPVANNVCINLFD